MRGLKYDQRSANESGRCVALYTSAWIEIMASKVDQQVVDVALYTSAWIEIWPKYNGQRFTERRTLHECVD